MVNQVSDNIYKVQNFTNISSDVTVTSSRIFKWFQVDIETPVAFTSGTVTIYYRAYGMSVYKPLLDSSGQNITISLANPKIIVVQDFAISDIKLVVSGADSGKTFNASTILSYDNAPISVGV